MSESSIGGIILIDDEVLVFQLKPLALRISIRSAIVVKELFECSVETAVSIRFLIPKKFEAVLDQRSDHLARIDIGPPVRDEAPWQPFMFIADINRYFVGTGLIKVVIRICLCGIPIVICFTVCLIRPGETCWQHHPREEHDNERPGRGR